MIGIKDWDQREQLRKKHRIMTVAEYYSWCSSGDGISSPSSANAFPGGLTILFGEKSYLGQVDNHFNSREPLKEEDNGNN